MEHAVCNSSAIAKQISNQFKSELGFVNRAALEASENKGQLEVIAGIGFCNHHHRRDGQTTIYEIAVDKASQGQGWGRLLFYRVLCKAIEKGQTSIFAKCPIDLPSNDFYKRLGFALERVDPGRRRPLNCWRYLVKLPLLFYCADGGRNKYSRVARDCNWALGLRSDQTDPGCHAEMVDNEWKKYDHDRHLEVVKRHKPLLCTARDIEAPEQLSEILDQAKELAQYAGKVLLVPKCKVPLPVDYWLAYSIPTSYAGTNIECSWFGDRPTHLLGGSPSSQARFAKHLNTVSIDGSYAMRLAKFGKSCWMGNDAGQKIVSGCYESFRVSLEKQRSYWRKEWSFDQEPLARLLS